MVALARFLMYTHMQTERSEMGRGGCVLHLSLLISATNSRFIRCFNLGGLFCLQISNYPNCMESSLT